MNAFRMLRAARTSAARRLFAAGCGAALLASLPLASSQAATTSATFTVTADVQTTCNITAQNLNFGGYTGLQLDSTTTLTVTCSNGVPWTIGLSAGTSSGATVVTRKMSGPGTDLLSYGLFEDASHSINWDNTGGVGVLAGTGAGTGTPQPQTVYGRIPAGQFVGPGAYSDTITATLTF